MKWISVKDELPPKSGSYLVAHDRTATTQKPVLIAYWDVEKQSWMLDNADDKIIGITAESITHWMELPDLPY